ncbi:MAG: YqjK-like family protein [Methylophilaceae bacterium]|jgi:hypothetical protein|nr:YqjK-like family protein [Methylophilaceae bacterium]
MNDKLIRLAERREHLIAQAEAQRTALARNVESWRQPLMLADQGFAAVRFVRRHPFWIGGIVFLLTALRPGRIGEKLRRGWVAWQVIRKLLGRTL